MRIATGAALHGLIAVAAGAFAAHHLRDRLDPAMLEVFRLAARYQMYHALALLGTAALSAQHRSRRLTASVWALHLGILLFSGSLYAMAVSGVRAFGWVTPFGGASLLVGWALLMASTWRRPAADPLRR